MLKKSVGKGGKNDKPDVIYVQQLLNKWRAKSGQLKVDGLCGKNTIKAIEQFQAEVVCLSRPDGRVDVAGKTIRNLESSQNASAQSTIPAGTGIIVKPSVSPTTKKPVTTQSTVTTPKTDPRKLKTRQAIAEAYGTISADKKWARQSEFLSSFKVPTEIFSHKDYNWINVYSPKKSKVTQVYCHKAMHPFLRAALKNLVAREQLANLKEFGGSHCIRATRGTLNWSAHSWALAIDINMTGNGLGQTPAMSQEFAQCFIDAGFGWGGNYSRKDGMHFTIAGFDMPRS